jgi:hypothetical protein
VIPDAIDAPSSRCLIGFIGFSDKYQAIRAAREISIGHKFDVPGLSITEKGQPIMPVIGRGQKYLFARCNRLFPDCE